MLIGYARVSTLDQNLDLQRAALEQAGCQKIYEDQMGGVTAEQPGLKLLLEVLRDRDPWQFVSQGKVIVNGIAITLRPPHYIGSLLSAIFLHEQH